MIPTSDNSTLIYYVNISFILELKLNYNKILYTQLIHSTYNSIIPVALTWPETWFLGLGQSHYFPLFQ